MKQIVNAHGVELFYSPEVGLMLTATIDSEDTIELFFKSEKEALKALSKPSFQDVDLFCLMEYQAIAN